MPLFEFQCKSCGYEHEELVKHDTDYSGWKCSCGGKLVKMISLFAKTPNGWGDMTGQHGVNGFWCVQSGRRFHNKREQEKWMNANGKIRVSDEELTKYETQHFDTIAKQDKIAEEGKNYLKQHRSIVK